ncbi:MAG: caspase family protein [Candidatus Schekmanbacteria bacterium]|nr:caspase family protein [Candidatus Schekmanbacteria bacterium]
MTQQASVSRALRGGGREHRPLAGLLRKAVLTMVIVSGAASTMARGSDRALLVGIERYGDPRVPATPGCQLDATATARFLQESFGFAPDSVKVLLDGEATAAGIVSSFREWLIAGSQPGDRVFFLYAGHGSQLPDDNGDETDDGFDETLAAYDVDPTVAAGQGQIRDDTFDELIARLSGRRAVLVFDSCHSGTIARGMPKLSRFPRGGGARYLPRPDQLALLAPSLGLGPDRARGIGGDDGYVLVPSATARGLEPASAAFVQGTHLGKVSGAVVISAAAPTQRAYPLEVDGKLRGALSYLFVASQGGARPTLRELRQRLTERIAALHAAGSLDGDQQPQVEVLSSVPLDDVPIFATWEQAPAVALSNPRSPIRVSIRPRGDKPFYRSGESLDFEVTTDTPGYLYVLAFSQQQVATRIFPNDNDRDGKVAAGSVTIPRNAAYSFPVQAPFGRDVLVALLSMAPVSLGEEVSMTWAEVFNRLGLAKLQDAVVGQATRRDGGSGSGGGRDLWGDTASWQAAMVVVETRE